jgi:hypothetical protein
MAKEREKFVFPFEKLELWQLSEREKANDRARSEIIDRKLHGLIRSVRGRS